ncbi:hypothetical protein L6452_05383 [Arctium lappa]|uniref:Uncharacterized protein n=1 Tax=Arctium lappa TaxID=4217 RepID=A0ACB9EGK1_ARCLA|nr:hypothetical protein L6452_05383 [Arctium lappa]
MWMQVLMNIRGVWLTVICILDYRTSPAALHGHIGCIASSTSLGTMQELDRMQLCIWIFATLISWSSDLDNGDSSLNLECFLQAILRLQLHLGQCVIMISPLSQELDRMQYSLREFYRKCHDGNISYGHFMKLATDIQIFRNFLFVACITSPSWTHLNSCKKCTSIPPLGQLPSLKELFIEGMDGLKVVGSELLGTVLQRLKSQGKLPMSTTLATKVSNTSSRATSVMGKVATDIALAKSGVL